MKLSFTILMILWVNTIFAQKFSQPSDRFDDRKMCYFTLNDGTKINGTVDKIKRTKGLIAQITIIKEGDDKKNKTILKPEDVAFMYLYPSGLDKLSNALSNAYDVTKWDQEKTKVDNELITKGYCLFESTETIIKKEKKKLLLQLLNPSFCAKVRAYHDPYAAEGGGMQVGGFQVTESFDKSFYVKSGDEPAFLLTKKNYRDNFNNVYKGCPDFVAKFPQPKWADREKHIITYTEDCK